MTNEEFYKYAEEHIRDYLPAGFEDAEIMTDVTVRPNDEVYHSLSLMRAGNTTAPKLQLERWAEAYRQGRPLDSIMLGMAEILASHQQIRLPRRVSFSNFEDVRSRLTTKLCDPENCRAYLSDKPWTPVGDWALLYRIQLSDDGQIVSAAPVVNDLLEAWGIDRETLHQEAVAVEREKSPAWMHHLLETAVHGAEVPGPNMLDSDVSLHPMADDAYVLSKRGHLNGACVVGWDGVLDRVGELLSRDFYIVPSSIHEVIIVPDFPETVPAHLEQTLRQGNANPAVVAREDVMSNRIQFYDRSTRTLGKPRRRWR